MQRAPVLQPHVRNANAGACVRRVAAGFPFRNVARLVHDQRRTGVGVGRFHPDHAMHPAMVDLKGRGEFPSLGLALGGVVVRRRGDQRAPDRHARGGPSRCRDVADPDRAALPLVAVEQAGTAPAFDHTGEFPGQVESVTNTGIHTEAASRNDQMHGIAGHEDAAIAVALGDQQMMAPRDNV
jgi:hypothetical protein